ncbi:hypothetical protein BDQ17DRAFT_1541639 [Cyathus striatus]|nr:hypothetical protein BDQ17DRAFT_1541639 [Cyathus striatus]
MSSSNTASKRKEEGNELFKNHDYNGAIEKFTLAIAEDATNAIFYANRAQCYLYQKKYNKVIDDTKKATELQRDYYKAWLRMADAYTELNMHPEAIEAYQKAIELLSRQRVSQPGMLKDAKIALERAREKVMNPWTMSLDTLKALARAYDIPVPKITSRKQIEPFKNTLFRNPKWGTEPLVRVLFIPQSQTEPMRELEIEQANFGREAKRLIGCRLIDTAILYSADNLAQARGNPYGIGYGRLHTLYEAVMDDSAIAKRPFNKRAAELLHRPKTFGPILMMKTTCIKTTDDVLHDKMKDVLAWEHVSIDELQSGKFKNMRKEYVDVYGNNEGGVMIEIGGPPVPGQVPTMVSLHIGS